MRHFFTNSDFLMLLAGGFQFTKTPRDLFLSVQFTKTPRELSCSWLPMIGGFCIRRPHTPDRKRYSIPWVVIAKVDSSSCPQEKCANTLLSVGCFLSLPVSSEFRANHFKWTSRCTDLRGRSPECRSGENQKQLYKTLSSHTLSAQIRHEPAEGQRVHVAAKQNAPNIYIRIIYINVAPKPRGEGSIRSSVENIAAASSGGSGKLLRTPLPSNFTGRQCPSAREYKRMNSDARKSSMHDQ